MLVGIVYESLFGNTREIAEAVAAGIRDAEPATEVAVSPAAEAEAHPQLAQVRLLVAGAPTHFLGLPSPRSRMMQLRYRSESASWYITGPVPRLPGSLAGFRPRPAGKPAGAHPPAGVREWLERLPPAAGDAWAAAFDTRLEKLMSGSAAREIGHRLRDLGYQLVASPEGFSVTDFEGPLADGERARARQWGGELCRTLRQREAATSGRLPRAHRRQGTAGGGSCW